MEKVRISRRAIWSFFEDLVEAACIMAYGCRSFDPATVQRDDWEPIIHCDLKPANVFFGLPRTQSECGIPKLKLGDIGLAVPRRWEGFENPLDMVADGTYGWMPPEQSPETLEFQPQLELSSATNIERIMLTLVELSYTRHAIVSYNKD